MKAPEQPFFRFPSTVPRAMKLLILSFLLIAAGRSALFANDDSPLSNNERFRHAIEQADCVAFVDLKNGRITPRLIFKGIDSMHLSPWAPAGGQQSAGHYLYIATSQKFDPADIHSSAWGSDSFISATRSSWQIPLEKGCLTLSDGHHLYRADLIGFLLNACSRSQ